MVSKTDQAERCIGSRYSIAELVAPLQYFYETCCANPEIAVCVANVTYLYLNPITDAVDVDT